MGFNKETVRVPLLDRLIDLHPNERIEAHPYRSFSRQELLQSVRNEMRRLLNTRSPALGGQTSASAGTVINYGLEDFSSLFTQNINDQTRVGKSIKTALERFEPRLKRVRVEVAPNPHTPRSLRISLEAILEHEGVSEAVSFPFLIESKQGVIEIYEFE